MEKYLCYECVGETYFSDEIKRLGNRHACSYCKETANSYTIESVAERVHSAFEQHFIRTNDQPEPWQHALLSDKESCYEWDRHGEQTCDAISAAAEVNKEVANDIQEILSDKFFDHRYDCGEEIEFSSEAYYTRKEVSDYLWQEKWSSLTQSIKYETRFFNRNAEKILSEIFFGINNWQTDSGRSIILDAGPNTNFKSIFRARVFQSNEKLEEALRYPDQHLSAPPPKLARAGRMNSHGISAFYGANDIKVAISEVRPPVGSSVLVGEFEIIRTLKLLDLTALGDIEENGSIFDPEYIILLQRTVFLRHLSSVISRPIMPDDADFEYLITQAIADYLADNEEMPLDGIIFPSSQAGDENRLNFALFQKASCVEKIIHPKEVKFLVCNGCVINDEDEIDYSVTQYMASKTSKNLVATESDFNLLESDPADIFQADISHVKIHDIETREPTLRLKISSICIHIILQSRFETKYYPVKYTAVDALSS